MSDNDTLLEDAMYSQSSFVFERFMLQNVYDLT